MGFIILTRTTGGYLFAIVRNSESDAIAEFDTRPEAEHAAQDNMLCRAYGYAVVDPEV